MDDETGAILAAKLKGDMEGMIRRVMAEALQDPYFWTDVHTAYPLQEAVFRNSYASSEFVYAVRQVMLTQMGK